MRIIFIIFCFLSLLARGQQSSDLITAAEYWIDTDPGFALGIDIPLSPENVINESVSVDISDLDLGNHLIGMRVKDENGKWSHTNFSRFTIIPVPTQPEITAIEYWVDTDDGWGDDILFSSLSPGDPITANEVLLSSLLTAEGNHLIGVRAYAGGKWSHTNFVRTQTIPEPEVLDIDLIEYFWVSDDGFESPAHSFHVPASISPSVIDTISVEVPSSFEVGESYQLFVRARDTEAKWSHTNFASASGITMYPLSEEELSEEVESCFEFITPNGTVITENGSVTEAVFNGSEFENITYTVSILEVELDVLLEDGVLTSQAENAEYQWLDCNNDDEPIMGETNTEFIPQDPGLYAVEVSQNGCTGVSECKEVLVVGIEDRAGQLITTYSIYPNPSNDHTFIKIEGQIPNVNCDIYDIQGVLVKSVFLDSSLNTIELSGLANGVYFFHIGDFSTKIIKHN